MNLSIEKVCDVIEGRFLHKAKREVCKGVSINSREGELKNKVFFAIKGDRFDGHNFLNQAISGGITAVVVSETPKELSTISQKNSFSIILVKDTLKALHQLASYWRNKTQVKIIGITGSVGKTTTKNFCHTLLQPPPLQKNAGEGSEPYSEEGVIANPKSFNNMYGVPLTLLSSTENTHTVIQEMGMNQTGEIKSLCELARPNIVTVTQVGKAHIGKLGSQKNIAKEKEEIYLSSPPPIPVFNLDNPYTKDMYERWKQKEHKGIKLFCFSSQEKTADVFLQIKEARALDLSIEGHIKGVPVATRVPIAGVAHLNNLMASSALALAWGLPAEKIRERLPFCRLPRGRSQWVNLASGAKAFFDAYNAGPESTEAFLEYILSPTVKGKKILILGDFLELGEYLKPFQQTIALKLAKNPVHLIWCMGSQAEDFAKIFKSVGGSVPFYSSEGRDQNIVKKITALLDSSTLLAFKAGRKLRLEAVLACFQPIDFPTRPFD